MISHLEITDKLDSAVSESLASHSKDNEAFNILEKQLAQFPKAECTTTHHFLPGLYCRQTTMPAGSAITSKIHKTNHSYCITEGVASIFVEGHGWVTLRAPFSGLTHAGTRRLLLIQETTTFTTFHPTQETDLKKIEAELIFPHDIPGAEHAEPISALGKQEPITKIEE